MMKSFRRVVNNHHFLPLLSILLTGLYALWPSFFLHFDGDSYLTLWRFQYNTGILNRSLIENFLTDYGPQDSIFAIMHRFFGFKPFYFYLLSFLLRYTAAWSTYFLIFKTTKNISASLFSGIFLIATITGLETTNWVFNMPSYISIIFLNLLLYKLLINSRKLEVKGIVIIALSFTLTIIFQPIRMMFLPVFITIFSIILFLFSRNTKLLIIPLVLTLTFMTIFSFTKLGDSVGAVGTPLEKISGKWLSSVTTTSFGLKSELQKGKYLVFLNPIGQLGRIIFPFESLKRLSFTDSSRILRRVIIPELAVFLLFFYFLLKRITVNNLFKVILNLTAIFWCLYLYKGFSLTAEYPMMGYEMLSFLLGGHFILIFILMFFSKINTSQLTILISGFLLIFMGFIFPWVRFPNSIIDTSGRYLIIPAYGFSIITGIIFLLGSKNKFIYTLLIPLLIFNIIESRNYLSDLNKYRSYKSTEKIRGSIPIISSLSSSDTTLFFFEADENERLYHSLMFGFPVMMYYYQEVRDIWNVAYTTDWQEVKYAYLTGEGFKRFGTIPLKPAKIDNIFSFKLEGDALTETTEVTRQQLIQLNRI